MQEEEAAAFQQGLLLSNLARASLGCLQGSVQQGRGRLVEHAGCLQAWVTLGSVAGTGTADRALETRHMSTQPCEPRPPVKVAALANRCWYSPFPSGIGVIFLWRWCLCWHKLLPSRAMPPEQVFVCCWLPECPCSAWTRRGVQGPAHHPLLLFQRDEKKAKAQPVRSSTENICLVVSSTSRVWMER